MSQIAVQWIRISQWTGEIKVHGCLGLKKFRILFEPDAHHWCVIQNRRILWSTRFDWSQRKVRRNKWIWWWNEKSFVDVVISAPHFNGCLIKIYGAIFGAVPFLRQCRFLGKRLTDNQCSTISWSERIEELTNQVWSPFSHQEWTRENFFQWIELHDVDNTRDETEWRFLVLESETHFPEQAIFLVDPLMDSVSFQHVDVLENRFDHFVHMVDSVFGQIDGDIKETKTTTAGVLTGHETVEKGIWLLVLKYCHLWIVTCLTILFS